MSLKDPTFLFQSLAPPLKSAAFSLPSHKNEDTASHVPATTPSGVAGWGVYDGHGGSLAALLCQDALLSRCGAGKGVLSDEVILEAFERMHEECSGAKDYSGTTASVALMQMDEGTGETVVKVAWVGDSRAILLNKASEVVLETGDHKLTNGMEKARVLKATGNNVMILTPPSKPVTKQCPDTNKRSENSKVRAKVDVTATGKSAQGSKSAQPAPIAPLEKLASMNLDYSEHAMEDVTTKSGNIFELLRLKKMEIPTLASIEGGDGDTDREEEVEEEADVDLDATELPQQAVRAPSATSPDAAGILCRRRSFIAQRITNSGEQAGPWCLFSGENGTSLAVTRSLGDVDGAKSCIGVPEIKTYRVKAGESARVMICSDGVWDVLSSEQAASKVAGIKNVASAARRISMIAKEKRVARRMGRDDIMTVVVDVGPEWQGAGCVGCTVS